MSEKKVQVWFRPDQAELTVECLKHVQNCLDKDQAYGAHAKVAGPFTYRRLAEIVALFGGGESK